MTGPRCSIVIPTRNEERNIGSCLDGVFRQHFPAGFEVLVIDSGSVDGTEEIISRYPVRLHRIPAEEFSHSGTRNLGAAMTDGEFIVFLTADAYPVGDDWLANLVAPFDIDPRIAGCFGRHVAHLGADLVDAWNMDRHFANFGPVTRIFRIDPDHEAEHRRLEWMYDFFSDNNSALRRSVWSEHPLPPVEMAEDHHWMKLVMRLGYAKAYVPDAVVRHSHSYTPWRWLRNLYDQHTSYRDLGSPVAMRRLPDALRYFVRSSREDVSYLRNLEANGSSGLRFQVRAVVNNAARAGGGYLGANYPRLPRRLRRRLTLLPRGAASGK